MHMSLISHIENLRARPEHVRRRVAFWYSFGATALIFVLWLAAFGPVRQNTQSTIANAVKDTSTPAQSLIAGVGSLFGDVRDVIWTPKQVKYADVELLPGNK